MKISFRPKGRKRYSAGSTGSGNPLVRNNFHGSQQDLEERCMLIGENLVETNGADFVAVRDGDWEDGSTWRGGRAPSQSGSAKVDVYIPKGRSVEISTRLGSAVETVNIEGTLSLAENKNTRLNVNSMRVGGSGRLELGSSNQRLNASNTAEIVFDGSSSVSRIPNDPSRLGKGLVVSPGGEVELYGATKTPFVGVANTSGNADGVRSLAKGSSSIVLNSRPSGWRTGDEISVAATEFTTNSNQQTENFRIRGIENLAGGKVRVLLGAEGNASRSASLKFNHRPIAGKETHIANLTRNVVLRSQSPSVATDHRGHIMIQSHDVVIDNIELRDLGRSDKKKFAEDGKDLDKDGRVNQRGRYALHFHRNLDAPGAAANNPAVVRGSVANSGPGWGLVSHSSNVDFLGNVAYGFDGAGIVAEAGDEIGRWDGNFAANGVGDGSFDPRRFEDAGTKNKGRVAGSAAPQNSGPFRIANGDLGFSGDGFWIQSPGLEVTNNVASGFAGRGFNIWTQGLFEADRKEEVGFRTEFIDWDSEYRVYNNRNGFDNSGRAVVGDLSFKKFEGNQAYGSRMGAQVRFHNNGNRQFAIPGPEAAKLQRITRKVGTSNNNFGVTEIKDFDVWNTDFGLGASYVTSLKISDSNFSSDKGDTALYTEFNVLGTTRFERVNADGFKDGINFNNQSSKFNISGSKINTDSNGVALRWKGRTFKVNNLPLSDSAAS